MFSCRPDLKRVEVVSSIKAGNTKAIFTVSTRTVQNITATQSLVNFQT